MDEVPASQVFIIPIRINNCEPEDEKLKSIQRVDYFPSYTKGLRKLIRILAPEKTLNYPLDYGERNDLSQIKYTYYKGVDIVQILGDTDPGSIEPLANLIKRTLPTCKYLIIGIPYNKNFTTIGVTLLSEILAYLKINNGKLAIVCQDEFIIDCLEISDLVPKFFNAFSSFDEALKSFNIE